MRTILKAFVNVFVYMYLADGYELQLIINSNYSCPHKNVGNCSIYSTCIAGYGENYRIFRIVEHRTKIKLHSTSIDSTLLS